MGMGGQYKRLRRCGRGGGGGQGKPSLAVLQRRCYCIELQALALHCPGLSPFRMRSISPECLLHRVGVGHEDFTEGFAPLLWRPCCLAVALTRPAFRRRGTPGTSSVCTVFGHYRQTDRQMCSR